MVKSKTWFESSVDYASKVFFFFLVVTAYSFWQGYNKDKPINLETIVAAAIAPIIASFFLGGIMAWLKTTKRGRNWDTFILAVVSFMGVWIIIIGFLFILKVLKII